MVVCIIVNIGFNHSKHNTGTDQDRGSISIGALTITAPPKNSLAYPKTQPASPPTSTLYCPYGDKTG